MLSAALLAAALLAASPGAGAAKSCRDILAAQVLLDRRAFSPGEIDGRPGANTSRALRAFQEQHGLPPTGALDCATFAALGGGQQSVLVDYTITAEDASGPFTDPIPDDIVEQAKLPALGYRSLLERLAERFKASPSLLRRLNPGAPFAAGATIKVPAVEPFDDRAKPAAAPGGRAAARVEVSREGWLQAFDADGAVVLFAPVSSGSARDPLPLGAWKVLSIAWMPVFNYNPDLFWDADPAHTRARIKPGPNNPVGTVWIDIDVEHYGIHGTPEPQSIGKAQSHGCVRLTNWDAARLAALLRPGTPVVFK